MTELLKFKAEWCGPCKAVTPILDQVVAANENVRLIEVDVDKQPELAQQYRVKGLPTVVALQDGVEVARVTGVSNRRVYEQLVNDAAKAA